MGFAFAVVLLRRKFKVLKTKQNKKKSVISLVHRIKGKKEGKVVCNYKTHLKNLVIQLKTQKPLKEKQNKTKHILTYQFEENYGKNKSQNYIN